MMSTEYLLMVRRRGKNFFIKSILTVSIILFISGCADKSGLSPKIRLPQNYSNISAKSVFSSNNYKWWREFGSRTIDRLVKTALKNNSDIKAAAEKILEMRAEFSGSHSVLFPSVYTNFNAARQRQNSVNGITGRANSYYFNSFHLSLSASYEIDLWKRLSSSDKAARAAMLETAENKITVIHAVISNSVMLYFEISGIDRRINLLKKERKLLRRIISIEKQRYENGTASLLDLKKSEYEFANKEMEFLTLKQQLHDKKYKLMILLGKYPNNTKPYKLFDFRNKNLPVLSDLPSSLLLKRPDIRAKILQINRMNFMLKAAHAARFPQINLTGSYGSESDALKDIFRPENILWQIASGISAPLFDAGKLKSSENAALHKYNEAVIDYAKTLMEAFYEVQNALQNNELLSKKRNYAEILLKNAGVRKNIILSRYKAGLSNLVTLYNAQMSYYQTSDLLNQTDLAFYLNRISLHKAIGGSWIKTEKKGEHRYE